jgi:hypothetical protein
MRVQINLLYGNPIIVELPEIGGEIIFPEDFKGTIIEVINADTGSIIYPEVTPEKPFIKTETMTVALNVNVGYGGVLPDYRVVIPVPKPVKLHNRYDFAKGKK